MDDRSITEISFAWRARNVSHRRPGGAFLILFLLWFSTAVSAEPRPPEIPDHALPHSYWSLLEGFEQNRKWNLNRPRFSDQSGNLEYTGLSEGPYAGSGVYLSLLFRGNRATPAILEPDSPMKLSGFAQEISLFVYGWDQPVRMTLILRDRKGRQVRSSSSNLQFQGWKRLSVALPPTIARQPEGPFQEWYMELLGIELRPIYNETLAVRLSIDDLFLLSAPAIQLPEPMRQVN